MSNTKLLRTTGFPFLVSVGGDRPIARPIAQVYRAYGWHTDSGDQPSLLLTCRQITEPTHQRTSLELLLGATPWSYSSELLLGETGAQQAEYLLRDQAADITAVLGDLLDQAGAQKRVQRIGRHEQRLYLSEAIVHLRHLHLVLEVADSAEPFDHCRIPFAAQKSTSRPWNRSTRTLP